MDYILYGEINEKPIYYMLTVVKEVESGNFKVPLEK